MNAFKLLCVYEIMLVLPKLNGKMLVKWLSEQFWSYCSYIYVLIETADEHENFKLLAIIKITVMLNLKWLQCKQMVGHNKNIHIAVKKTPHYKQAILTRITG